ncbi:MAG: arsenite methyltransferase [Chloroflexi bacterium]|nr:arsenite methyltransferase [Chloroflexota bacterium]
MSTLRVDDIRQAVRERYGDKARGASAGTVDGEAKISSGIYAVSEVKALPMTVIAASAGCGNPVALAELRRGDAVLDLGSGGGIDCFLAAGKVGTQGRVLGVDMTSDMVRLARDNARRIGVGNVSFMLGEIERLPLKGNLLDVVMSNCVICLSKERDSVFQEAFRVLKPGGRLYISDMVLTGELPADVQQDPAMWVSCIGGAEPKETYLDRMRRSGFSMVEVVEEVPYWREVEKGEEWKRNLLSISVRATRPLG